jgi:tetratricopeptide (TPR) repeat protein
VANFLRLIPKEEQTKRQLALDAALFSRPFNQDDLEAFTYVPEQERQALYHWLIGQPFVRPQDDQYSYHDVARELFRQYLYQHSRKGYYATRRALVQHYQRLLEEIQREEGKDICRSTEWFRLILALVSQLLCLPDEASHIKAIEHILYAHPQTNKEQLRTIARALRDLSQEPSFHYVSPTAQSVAVQLLSYIEAEVGINRQGSQEWLAASDALLEKIRDVSSFSSELLASIYSTRGNVYRSLGEKELANENFQQALKLLGPMNYFDRGWVYFYSQNFQEALAFQNRALEHNPRDAGAYIGRGWAYLRLENYQFAIADFNHAAELDPNENPGGRENGLRWAYYRTGQYQQALSANDLLLERDPDYPEDNYVFRSRCFLSLKDYPLSIDACNHALELAPKRADTYFQRGLTYLWLKGLGQAQADFTRTSELEPTTIEAVLLAEWVGMCHGAVDLLVSERLEAIATVALQSYTAHVCLGIALLLHRNLEGALAELEHALQSRRRVWNVSVQHDKWEAHFWKGMTCAYLEQDEEAIAAIEKAMDLELPPILLTPLRWFEQDRLDFYQKYVVPLMARYDLV